MKYGNFMENPTPMPRFKILLLCLAMGIAAISVRAQEDSFLYMEDGQFYKGCSNFYPVIMNYSVMFEDSAGSLRITPPMNHCESIDNCNSCGITANDYRKKIADHLESIVEMGFNTLRIVGLPVRFEGEKDDEGNFQGTLSTSSYYEFRTAGSGSPHCHIYHKQGMPLADIEDFKRHADLIGQLFSVIRSYKLPLRVMLLTGEHGVEAVPELYGRYLNYLAVRFSGEPLLFAYDLYNEPAYQEIIDHEVITKYDRANWFYTWYRAVKDAAPWHFVTYGPVISDIFSWDPEVMPADFFAYHLYSLPLEHTNWSYEAAFDAYRVYLAFATRSFSKPWMLGETGLAAIDPALYGNPLIHPVVCTLEEQRHFVRNTLKYVDWYGIGGYAYWIYKDPIWSFDQLNEPVARQFFIGLVHYRENNEWKPAAWEFKNYHWGDSCMDCTPPDRELYYNPMAYPVPMKAGYVFVRNADNSSGEPCVNALIRGTIGAVGSGELDHPFLTFSDEKGKFTIRSLYEDDDMVVKQIRVSAPGKSTFYTSNWSKGVDVRSPIYIEPLDLTALPSILPPGEKRILAGKKTLLWDENQVLQERTLVIKKGVRLVISDTLWVKPGTRIEVMKGGVLEITAGGAIIGLCKWDGIDVYTSGKTGRRKLRYQGKVILGPGAVLENNRYRVRKINAKGELVEQDEEPAK